MTLWSNGNVSIGSGSNYKLYVQGDVYCTGQYLGSDKLFKKNITPVTGALNKILLLKGIEFNYDGLKLLKLGEKANLSLNDTISNNNLIDTLAIQNIEKPRRIGYLGEDFEKVLPECVKKDSNNFIAINYVELIPIITEALKELDSINKQQDNLIADLEKRIEKLENKNNSIDVKSAEVPTGMEDINQTDKPLLEQNVPNPFNVATTINFYIPQSSQKAVIYIYDMQGLQKKAYTITTKGKLNITINGTELQAGIYLYALIVDGKEVDIKRMILTE